MAFGSSTFSGIGGAVSDLFSSEATASGLRLKATGNRVEAGNYDLAATLARQNEQFTEQSTAVKEVMATRQIQMGAGSTEADIAGAGFSNSGSALDLLRSGAQQGALQKQILGQQGLITEAGYREQASAFDNLASYARYAATVEDDQAGKSERAGMIGAVFKGAAALASLA